MSMCVRRVIVPTCLTQAYCPAIIVTETINEMRSYFAPAGELNTRIWMDSGLIVIEVSL